MGLGGVQGWGDHLTSFWYDTYPTPCPSPEMGGELLRIDSALAPPSMHSLPKQGGLGRVLEGRGGSFGGLLGWGV